MLSNNGNTLNIKHFELPFEECQNNQGYRVYGRYRHCSACYFDFVEISDSDPQTAETFINCRKGVDTCNKDEVYLGHQFYYQNSYQLFTIVDQNGLPIKGCYPRYNLTQEEKAFNIDDGCPPQYKLDLHGSCRACIGTSLCSVCTYGIKLCIPLNILNYTKEKLDEKIFLKGYENAPSYKSIYFSEESRDIIEDTHFQIWVNQTNFPRLCYSRKKLIDKEGEYSYQLSARSGYFLEKADEVGIDISKQKEPNQDNDPLNTYVCVKNCILGFYYDYQSISCKKCSYKCAKCSSFEVCDLCFAGYNAVEVTEEDKEINVWAKQQKNKCSKDCNKGSFKKAFDGKCYTCDQEECLECIDPLGTHGKEKSYCTKCKNGKEFYLDLHSGKCIKICGSFGRFARIDDNENKICDYCGDENCERCKENNRNLCLSCKSGMEFNAEKEECVEEEFNTRLWAIVGLIAAFGLFVLIFILLLIAEKKEKKKKIEFEEMMKFENYSNSIPFERPFVSKILIV